MPSNHSDFPIGYKLGNNTSTKTSNIFRCCGVSIDTIETMLEHCQENHSDEMINQNPKMCDKCD